MSKEYFDGAQWSAKELEQLKATHDAFIDASMHALNMMGTGKIDVKKVLDEIDALRPDAQGMIQIGFPLYRTLLGTSRVKNPSAPTPFLITQQKLRIERAAFIAREVAKKMENS